MRVRIIMGIEKDRDRATEELQIIVEMKRKLLMMMK